MSAPLLVTLTVDDLRQIIREEVAKAGGVSSPGDVRGWLTTTEAGRLMARDGVPVDRSTVRRWADDGKIPDAHVMRSGNRVRISRAWATGQIGAVS